MSADYPDRLTAVLEVAAEDAARVDADAAFPKAAVDALRASGLMGLTVRHESGGLGRGPCEFVVVSRRLAEVCGSTAMIYLMHISALMCTAATPPRAPSDAVRQLAEGEWLGTLAFSEKGSRSHFWAPVSRASNGRGTIRLRADKSFVTSAGKADFYVVSTGGPDGQVDLYGLTADTKGLEVGEVWTGMGLRGNASSPMTVDSAVAENTRFGEPGEGLRLMLEVVLPWFNLGNAAISLGLASAAAERAISHASAGKLEHLGESLASVQSVRQRLARMKIALEAQLAYLDRAATSVAEGSDDAILHVLAVKAAANDAALEITDDAMRVCGGAAYSRRLSVDRFFRDARAGHVMAPTADILYDFYGKAITGQELF
jgi:alkylation response protein AidB-like acyl-CoA dehydrogenase